MLAHLKILINEDRDNLGNSENVHNLDTFSLLAMFGVSCGNLLLMSRPLGGRGHIGQG